MSVKVLEKPKKERRRTEKIKPPPQPQCQHLNSPIPDYGQVAWCSAYGGHFLFAYYYANYREKYRWAKAGRLRARWYEHRYQWRAQV